MCNIAGKPQDVPVSKEVWGYHEHPQRREPDWEVNSQTAAVREGLARSGFGETSEALYLNSGFTYSDSQEAVDSFTDETDHFLYSRFHNPTVAMFEKRLAAIEGADHCVATGSGMATMFASGQLIFNTKMLMMQYQLG